VAQYYLIPKSLADRFPALGRAARVLEAKLLQGLFWCVQRLRPEHATRIAGALFAAVGPFTEKARKAERNLAVAFPERDAAWRRRTVRGIFRSLGEAAAELIKMERIWQERDERLEFAWSPAAKAHVDAGGATVFVSAHVGAWQLTNLIARERGLRVSTVYAPESNPLLHDAVQDLRRAFGVQLVPTEAGVRPLIRELKAGHSVGLATDTRLNTGELLPFFGREALTNTTAARLALRTGAALIPVHCLRLGGARYRIVILDPLQPRDPAADPEAQALDLSRQINAQFEDWIRATPAEWICLKRRWPKAHRL
jgi:KDO2-lipid IV(A) lauroyltransferase